jgi:alcohol dehydrogenase class IV
MAAQKESYYQAFPEKSKPYISTGQPYIEALAHHIVDTLKVQKVFIIVSASIAKTKYFKELEKELYYTEGVEVVGVKKGIKSHTPWNDIMSIVKSVRKSRAQVIVTLGAGSLTDGAKVISWVSLILTL